MTIWILDTDHTSLFLAGNKSVIAQVAEHSNNIAIYSNYNNHRPRVIQWLEWKIKRPSTSK